MSFLRSKAGRLLALALLAAVMAAAAYFATRRLLILRDPAELAAFQARIAAMGFGGWLLLLAIQYLQIVIAVIPGGPIQLVAGALFGPVGGLLTCVLGIALATATVFGIVQRFGHKVVALFVSAEESRRYSFLSDEKRLERLVFLLFLIPGTPKDALTYLFALTAIALSRFLFLSIAARIPAALTSTLAGGSIIEGDWMSAIACFSVLTAVSIAGLLLHRRLTAAYSHKKLNQGE